MYPVIDIPPSSPSLKRTQREANFLSRSDLFSRTDRSVDRRQHIAVGKDWTMVVACSVKLFRCEEEKEKERRGARGMRRFLYVRWRAARGDHSSEASRRTPQAVLFVPHNLSPGILIPCITIIAVHFSMGDRDTFDLISSIVL